ncbi:MAG TPA: MFS transporter [Silvibacterium sp.]|nr:MFS transporter [Silvibacterium sp.]
MTIPSVLVLWNMDSTIREQRSGGLDAPGSLALESIEEQLPPPDSTGLGPPSGVVAVCLCGVFAFLNLYVTQPLLPLFSLVFREPKSVVSSTVSAATLGVAISAPILGALAEHLSRKRVIVTSIVVLAIPTLLAATSPGLLTLDAWRFLQGLILPGIFAIAITYIGEEWDHHAVPLVMSIYVSGTALGGFLGRIVSGLVAEHFNWRWSFALLAVLTLAGAAMVALWLPTETRPMPQGPHPGLITQLGSMLCHFRNPHLVATFGVGAGMLFTLVGTFTYITYYLADPPFHLSTAALSYLFAIYLIGLVVTPAGGYLVTHIGMRAGIAVAICCSLAGVLLTLSHSLWIVVIVGLGLVCSGVFIAQATANSFLRLAAAPGTRASAAGLYICCYYLGGTVGGVLPSYVWELGRWPACVVLIASVLLVTLFIALTGWKLPRVPRAAA